MDVRLLDETALADDTVVRERWELAGRSQRVGREAMPFWTLQDFAGALRSPDSGERRIMLDAYDRERLVGWAIVWFPLLDNLEKAWFGVDVDPVARRRGVGTALAQRVEAEARQEQRTLLLTSVHLPMNGRESHGYARFARSQGYQPSIYEVVRHLRLPVPEASLQRHLDAAATRHDGYRIATFVDEVPTELIDSLCVLLGQLAVDAPTGTVDFEEEKVTPQRYAEMVDVTRAMGRARYETLALTPAGEVAAQSTLAVPLGDGREIYQWGTFVHREHRGHRLGMAVKAANLSAAQTGCPGALLVTTQNAETNAYMVSINDAIGFEPVETAADFVKHL